jgi:hypothetical protein
LLVEEKFMPIRRRVAAAAVSLVLGAGGAMLAEAPAEAAIDTKICNSADGFTWIKVKHSSSGIDYLLWVGQCAPWLSNGSGQISVDTDPYGSSHSYKIKVDGGSYGDCHVDSDNHSSNPPNVNKIVYYKNYDHGNCTN